MPSLPILVEPGVLEVRAWVSIVRIYHRMARRLGQVLDRHGLTVAQFEVLAVLSYSAGVTQQELAARLFVTKGNICGLIDRMEAAGWVERRPDPEDRRANRLYLKPAGETVMAAAIPPHDQLVHHLFRTLEGSRLEHLYQMLQDVSQAMDEEDL